MIQTSNLTSELVIPKGIPTIEAKAKTKTTFDSKIEMKKMLKVIQSPGHLFMLFPHQIYHLFIIYQIFHFF